MTDEKHKDRLLLRVFAGYRPLLLLTAFYMLCVLAFLVGMGGGFLHIAKASLYCIGMVFMLGLVFLTGLYLYIYAVAIVRFLVFGRERTKAAWQQMILACDRRIGVYIVSESFLCGLAGLLAFSFVSFFFLYKSLLRFFNDYTWDPVFAAMDKALHGGVFPHEVLLPVLQAFRAEAFVAGGYFLWFPMMYLMLGYALFCDADIRRKMTFIWCFSLSWIVLGTIGAYTFASVGPVFYSFFYEDAPVAYLDFAAYLRGHDSRLVAGHVGTFNLLINWATNDRLLNPNMLSAMPSLHVAVAFIGVFYFWTVGRWQKVAAIAYFLLIMVGSVSLGYHYAVDGYFSAIAVAVLWPLSAWIAGQLRPGIRSGKGAAA